MLNRLLGIVYLLMNKGTVTAKELAERFEVSIRTIYRDVETLSMAGIPVYARKGKNGGISLTEQFVLNKMIISEQEQRHILSALASLQETGAAGEAALLQKLGDFFKAGPENWVSIDFSDWSGRRKELFEQLKEAIVGRRVLKFDYYGQYGEMSSRTVEPVQLLFKEYTWYLRAWCRDKQAMRLFKVLRMKRVELLEEEFAADEGRFEVSEDQELCSREKDAPEIVLLIDKKEAYRIYDRFDEEEITVLPEGDFQVRMHCPLDDWGYGLILSFGPSAKVIEPREAREELLRRIALMKEQYEE
ncbi:MAG: YafY family protein [Bacillota bacterium]|nr:YafY family protein [Bacillota bacterium]